MRDKLDDSSLSGQRRALLDTTVQLDRLKFPSRKDQIESVLGTFNLRFSTSFSLVEFKATIIQECITIHNQLRLSGARFTRARDILLEKNHPQTSLRCHIFNNLLNIHSPSAFEITVQRDEELAETARLALENIIPRLYQWFRSDICADSMLDSKLRCDRAKEAPIKKSAAFSTNLPNCQRGKNKNCRVEQLIRDDSQLLVDRLQPSLKDSEQLSRAVETCCAVKAAKHMELSVSDCRRLGDCLIALEGVGFATHAISSNSREWGPISEAVDYEFVPITFPSEKSR